LGANNFTDRGIIDIFSGLQWHVNLEEIYIGNNQFTEVIEHYYFLEWNRSRYRSDWDFF
jgi:hypothetical protein